MQQSSLPLGALMGFFAFGDRLTGVQWAGVTVTSAASDGVLHSSRKLIRFRTSRYSCM